MSNTRNENIAIVDKVIRDCLTELMQQVGEKLSKEHTIVLNPHTFHYSAPTKKDASTQTDSSIFTQLNEGRASVSSPGKKVGF